MPVPDIGAIAAMVSSIKSAAEITKAIIGVRDSTMIQAKVIELNSVILSAQSSAFEANAAQSALLERVRDLERQIAKLEAWETEKQRYELTEIGTGAFAYVIKNSMRGAEPMHCICSECYQNGQKAVLQMVRNTFGSVSLRCPRCKNEIQASEDHENYPLKREYAEDPAAKARGALEDCPICGTGKLAVKSVKPHPIFGDVGGLQVRSLQCDNSKCGHKEDRDYDPNSRR